MHIIFFLFCRMVKCSAVAHGPFMTVIEMICNLLSVVLCSYDLAFQSEKLFVPIYILEGFFIIMVNFLLLLFNFFIRVLLLFLIFFFVKWFQVVSEVDSFFVVSIYECY